MIGKNWKNPEKIENLGKPGKIRQKSENWRRQKKNFRKKTEKSKKKSENRRIWKLILEKIGKT